MWDEIRVEGAGLHHRRRRNAVNETLRNNTKIWMLLSVKTLYFKERKVVAKVVTDELGSVHNCDVELILDDEHVSLPYLPIQSREA